MKLYKYDGPVLDQFKNRVRCDKFVAFTHASSKEDALQHFKRQYLKTHNLTPSASVRLKLDYIKTHDN